MKVLAASYLINIMLHLGAGCIWNDILDRNFDRQVGTDYFITHGLCSSRQLTERTKNRPIASGAISVPGALVFLFIHLGVLFRMIWGFDPAAYTALS